jgi:hypothetical protein
LSDPVCPKAQRKDCPGTELKGWPFGQGRESTGIWEVQRNRESGQETHAGPLSLSREFGIFIPRALRSHREF